MKFLGLSDGKAGREGWWEVEKSAAINIEKGIFLYEHLSKRASLLFNLVLSSIYSFLSDMRLRLNELGPPSSKGHAIKRDRPNTSSMPSRTLVNRPTHVPRDRRLSLPKFVAVFIKRSLT